MPYTKRFAGGFIDLPSQTTPLDSAFANAVEAALLKLFGTDPTIDGQVMAWVAAQSKFLPSQITNAMIAAAAGIDKTKLGPLNIADADVAVGAAIAGSKIANLPISKLLGYTGNAGDTPRGDGTWKRNVVTGNKISDLGAGTDGQVGRLRVLPATYANAIVALPAGTITVGDTTGFAAAGTLNTPYGNITYTGKTGTTFTGCAGGAGTFAVGDKITQDPATTTSDAEYVQLIYDGVLGKWVSPQQFVPWNVEAGTFGAVPTAGSWVPATTTLGVGMIPVHRWRWYDAAGLQPQARIGGGAYGPTAIQTNVQIRIHWFSADYKDAANTFTDIGADTTSASNVQASAPVASHIQPGIVTPWSNVIGGYAIKDQLFISVDFFVTATAGGSVAIDHPTAMLRWVG